jgi:hypothetical protein
MLSRPPFDLMQPRPLLGGAAHRDLHFGNSADGGACRLKLRQDLRKNFAPHLGLSRFITANSAS